MVVGVGPRVVGNDVEGLVRDGSAPGELSVALISTCLPRRCGIASFSAQLADGIKAASPGTRLTWVAVDRPDTKILYGPQARWRIYQSIAPSYAMAAEQLSASEVDVVLLQHEFGLYGGRSEEDPDHLELFLAALRKPLVTTLHTIPAEPSTTMRACLNRLGRRSETVLTNSEAGRRILLERYDVDPGRVRMVRHGAPVIDARGRDPIKERLGLAGRSVVTSFGFVSRDKGLGQVLEALQLLRAGHPEVTYLSLGTAHPDERAADGQRYIDWLRARARELEVTDQVRFMDWHLLDEQIVDCLVATDVYVSSLAHYDHVSSGTLSWAVAAGRAVVATRYAHAVELLGNGRGLLVEPGEPLQLASAIQSVLDDPLLKSRLEQRAAALGRTLSWQRTGQHVLEVLRQAAGTALGEAFPGLLGQPA
jgi:polysaccharide biosynthesis protein PslF